MNSTRLTKILRFDHQHFCIHSTSSCTFCSLLIILQHLFHLQFLAKELFLHHQSSSSVRRLHDRFSPRRPSLSPLFFEQARKRSLVLSKFSSPVIFGRSARSVESPPPKNMRTHSGLQPRQHVPAPTVRLDLFADGEECAHHHNKSRLAAKVALLQASDRRSKNSNDHITRNGLSTSRWP